MVADFSAFAFRGRASRPSRSFLPARHPLLPRSPRTIPRLMRSNFCITPVSSQRHYSSNSPFIGLWRQVQISRAIEEGWRRCPWTSSDVAKPKHVRGRLFKRWYSAHVEWNRTDPSSWTNTGAAGRWHFPWFFVARGCADRQRTPGLRGYVQTVRVPPSFDFNCRSVLSTARRAAIGVMVGNRPHRSFSRERGQRGSRPSRIDGLD